MIKPAIASGPANRNGARQPNEYIRSCGRLTSSSTTNSAPVT
jgi:hypothetical protein